MERYHKYRSITPIKLAPLNSNSKVLSITSNQATKKENNPSVQTTNSRRSSLKPRQILNSVKSEDTIDPSIEMPIISAAKIMNSSPSLKAPFTKNSEPRQSVSSFPKIVYSVSQTHPNSISNTPSNLELQHSVKQPKLPNGRFNPGRSISASHTPGLMKHNTNKRLDYSYTLTNPKADFSERLAWSRRTSNSGKPLLIIVYTGVLGDYFFETLWSEERKHYLAPNLTKGYGKLKEHFQIVLFIGLGKKLAEPILKNLKSLSITFDAVYRRRKQSSEYFRQDYSQIYSDFEISNKYVRTSVYVIYS